MLKEFLIVFACPRWIFLTRPTKEAHRYGNVFRPFIQRNRKRSWLWTLSESFFFFLFGAGRISGENSNGSQNVEFRFGNEEFPVVVGITNFSSKEKRGILHFSDSGHEIFLWAFFDFFFIPVVGSFSASRLTIHISKSITTPPAAESNRYSNSMCDVGHESDFPFPPFCGQRKHFNTLDNNLFLSFFFLLLFWWTIFTRKNKMRIISVREPRWDDGGGGSGDYDPPKCRPCGICNSIYRHR